MRRRTYPRPSFAGVHAIGEQERDRARVVGDDAIGRGIVDRAANALNGRERVAAAIRAADGLLDRLEQRREEIRVIVAGDALERRRYPLEARARVHRRLGQRDELAVRPGGRTA